MESSHKNKVKKKEKMTQLLELHNTFSDISPEMTIIAHALYGHMLTGGQ